MFASWKEAAAIPSWTCRKSVNDVQMMSLRRLQICRRRRGPHRASQHDSWDEGGLLGLTRGGVFVHHSKVAVVSPFNVLTMGISAKDSF